MPKNGTTGIEVSVAAFALHGQWEETPDGAIKHFHSVQNSAGGNILLEADDIKTMRTDVELLDAPL